MPVPPRGRRIGEFQECVGGLAGGVALGGGDLRVGVHGGVDGEVGERGDRGAAGLGGQDALADASGAFEGVDAAPAVGGFEPVGELFEREVVVVGEGGQAEGGVEEVGEEVGGGGGIGDSGLGIRGGTRDRRPGAGGRGIGD
ncbi:MAG: hypothetical protein R3B57_04355 [Phycisphaerales bacterium]